MRMIFLVFTVIIMGAVTLQAEHNRHDMALNATIGGVGLRYFITDGFAFEILGQYGDDVLAGGARQYFYFNPNASKLPFYFGLEQNYLVFDTDISEGTGTAYSGFVGGEYFLNSRLSIQSDFGAAYVDLEDDQTTLAVDDVSMVVNIGLQVYFSLGRGK